ncbi:MAG: septum formation protein Maf [Clostridiales bacterium]|nr:septum formation protein Maf [Clostridiales bacterium]
MKIILASSSPRRKQLLEQMGLQFDIIPAGGHEELLYSLDPEEMAQELAYNKALEVASGITAQTIIIGADTIVVKGGILGKPKSQKEAIEMLLRLQSNTHQVITGLALIDPWSGKVQKGYEKTLVEMAPMTLKDIEYYVATGEPMDKAGGYGIQGLAGVFISKIEGCYFNVMGLPIHRLWKMLGEFGVDIFDNLMQ